MYCIILYFTVPYGYSVLLFSILLYPTLCCSTPYSDLLYCIILYCNSLLLFSILLFSTLCCSTPYSDLLYCTITLFYCSLFYCTLLYAPPLPTLCCQEHNKHTNKQTDKQTNRQHIIHRPPATLSSEESHTLQSLPLMTQRTSHSSLLSSYFRDAARLQESGGGGSGGGSPGWRWM